MEHAPSPHWGEGRGEGALPPTATQHIPYLPPGLRPPGWDSRRAWPPAPAQSTVAISTIITNRPDIQVAYISREPLYPAYAVEYPDGWTPVLRPGTENDKHFPDLGEPVTFTAHVANRGPQTSGPFTYRWRLNGADVLSGTLPGLAPGQWISLTMPWQWDPARHWLAFVADGENVIAEVSEQNNRLDEATDALYHDVRVHPYIYEAFANRPNLRGSFTFEDWLQGQYAKMNERFAQAVYPEAPQGILERVRVNSIRVTTDLHNGLPHHDGGWQFDVPPDDPDTPEDESRLGAEEYAAGQALGIDWGLIHELAHQVGFIDLYMVNVGMENVTMLGKDGLPLLMSYACSNCDLMGGGNTAPYRDGTYFSSYAAAAINRNYGQRRGYYGEFMFDIPQTNVLVLRDNAGAPLAGAQVQIYQSQWGGLTPAPILSGTSNASGVFILPNRPVSVEITTATGHTLRANPFGRIDVVGRNAQLLIKVSRSGHEDYLWKQILDFNLAYWAGMTQTYAFSWQTHLPPLGAPAPVAAMTGRFEQGHVSLSWPAQAGAASYRIYATEEPYHAWQRVGTTAAPAFNATPTWHTRYSVTVVDGSGRESGFGPIYRSFHWVYPSDAFYDERRGLWVVLDTHSGQLVDLLPDGRIVGNRLSPTWPFVGGNVAAQRANGDVAILQESTVTLFNRQFQRLGYIGQAEREPPRLEQATGIVLAGEEFSTTVRPDQDAQTLFLAHFDGDLTASGSEPLAADASFTSGVSGQAVQMGPGARLVYASAGHFTQQQGGLDFWLGPQWDGTDGPARTFFVAGDGISYTFEIGAVGGWLYVYISKHDGYNELALWRDISGWRAGQWHHVGVAWMPRWLKLYVDGEMADMTALKRPLTGTLGVLTIGANRDGEDPALAAIDEMRISSFARVGNSDHVRVLASEESRGRLKLLDLMGNVRATWSDPRLARPRALALRPNGWVAVADAGDGTIKLLSYDGRDTLAYKSLFASGFSSLQTIKSNGDRLIVPDYGHGLVKIFAGDGSLQTEIAAPNDGYAGGFSAPAAAVRSPSGDLLVVDKGKRRIVFVRQSMLDRRQYLPLVVR